MRDLSAFNHILFTNVVSITEVFVLGMGAGIIGVGVVYIAISLYMRG